VPETLAPAVSVVSIVMPAYNEAEILATSVGDVIGGLRARSLHAEMIVVENGSTDGTLALARELACRYPELRVESLRVADYGAALRHGLLAATGEFVVNFDADYYDLEFLDAALARLVADPEVVVVVGSKLAPGAADARSRLRRLATAVFSTVLRRGFGLGVSDTHGMKAMRRGAVLDAARGCRLAGDLFDTELILRLERAGGRTGELPVAVAERRPARTSILRRVPRTLVGLVRLRRALRAAR
jgi:glycosyltransferase involved in cell wall biosynthesis